MKNIDAIFFLSAAVLLASTAPAQTGDWQAVKNLQPGTKISVHSASPFHNLCIFERATDEQLVCEHILHGPAGRSFHLSTSTSAKEYVKCASSTATRPTSQRERRLAEASEPRWVPAMATAP